MLRCASVLISLTAKSGWKSSKRQGILPPFHQVPAVPGKNSNWQVKLNGYLQRIELLFLSSQAILILQTGIFRVIFPQEESHGKEEI